FSFMKWLIAHGASRSEGENGVAVGRIGGEARQARRSGHGVARDQRKPVRFGILTSAEDVGAAGRHARDLVFDGLVERVRWMIDPGQHAGPSRSGSLEDQLDVLMLLLEIIGGGQRVEDAAEGFLSSLRIRKDDDGGLGGGHGWLLEGYCTERSVQ